MALTDPDKFGLLVQCRAKMDELNSELLEHYSQFVISLLSTAQLKSLLFTGLNAIKHHVASNQLIQMKSTLNELIQNEKKAKTKKQNQNQTPSKNAPTILIVPKNASLTKTIPFDIISNAICHFLKMSSITNLACCDRKLATICHTPTSINNLMHRHDPYGYNPYERNLTIHDGYYYGMSKWTVPNIHRFKNVERLSIDLQWLDPPEKINSFGRVKHLSFYGAEWSEITEIATGLIKSNGDKIQIMPLLESLSFVGVDWLSPVSVVASQLCNKSTIRNQIKELLFVDCEFEDLERFYDVDNIRTCYSRVVQFLLPPQPNRLEVLKFENSSMPKTDIAECKDANDQLNIDGTKSSLCNLTGLVYEQPARDRGYTNLFFYLSRNILSNLVSFKQLESIHTHCEELMPCYLSRNNIPALATLNELCISISMKETTTFPLSLLCALGVVLKLEKLCLVIKISDDDHGNIQSFKTRLQDILIDQRRLKLLQIVMIMDDKCDENDDENDPEFCTKRLKIVTETMNQCVKVLDHIRVDGWMNVSKQPLLFRFHVKSSHYMDRKCTIGYSRNEFAASVKNMIINYLITYPIGKIQFKFTWNAKQHDLGYVLRTNMDGLDVLFQISLQKSGNIFSLDEPPKCCYNDSVFKQYAISAVTKRISEQDINHENRWNVDCRYCCNTPWV
eukprot:750282_1